MNLDNIPPFSMLLAQALVLFLGIGLHEYAHCKFADMAGDPTPRMMGRVTLNLTKHFEPLGVLFMALTMITGFGIGWGRAAISDPRKMRNPRWDFFVSVAAGPISNLAQATIYALLFRILMGSGAFVYLAPGFPREFFMAWITFGVLINLGLFFFNLIPFGPLDGHWLLGLLLPEPQRYRWFRFNAQVGFGGLMLVLILLQSQHVSLLSGPVSWGFRALTGTPL